MNVVRSLPENARSDAPASDYLEIGDCVAVLARNAGAAKQSVAGITGVPFKNVRVVRRWMKRCDCEECAESGPVTAHGWDEFWVYCDRDDPKAWEWWVESDAAPPLVRFAPENAQVEAS